MIKLQVIGHLGKDADTKEINGKTVINFSVAHSSKFKNAKGEDVEKTIWVSCAYWPKTAAVASYLKKGTQVYVEGEPDVRSYVSKQGEAGCSLEVRVMNVQLLGGAQAKPEEKKQTEASTPTQAQNNVPADDLPF